MQRMRMGWMLLGLAACGPQVDVPESESSGTTTSTTAPDPSTSIADTGTTTTATSTSVGTSSPPNPTTIDPDTTTLDPETTDDPTDDSLGFIQDPDGSCSCFECDLWAQDCPRGEKCMPWANDGGNAWNAARCSPVEQDPDQPGDPCTVEGSGVSGIDSCDISTMCWNVDPETNTGTCVAFCSGSEANPTCEAMCEACTIANEGYLILCLDICDPAAGACPDGQVCTPFGDAFHCLSIGPTVALGEVCDQATPCGDGLRCASANELPSCAGESCCAPWCSLADPESCADVPGTTCQPIDFGEVPGCVDAVGYCALP